MKHKPIHTFRSKARQRAWNLLRNSNTGRLAALLGGAEWIRWRADLVGALAPTGRHNEFRFSDVAADQAYFHHRAEEERQAASVAVERRARKAHQDLAAKYTELAAGLRQHSPELMREARKPAGGQTASHRQELLLDAGLAETFPASDPVSVPRIS